MKPAKSEVCHTVDSSSAQIQELSFFVIGTTQKKLSGMVVDPDAA